MDKYEELKKLQANLEENLKTLEEQEDLSVVEEEIKTLENRIEQVKRYAKLVEFQQGLNKLYKARLEAKNADEAREIEVDMKYYMQGNDYFFSAKYRNDIAKLDKEFYKDIKEKYGVSLISPERFMKELEEGRYVDENGQVQHITVNQNLLKIVDTRASTLADDQILQEIVDKKLYELEVKPEQEFKEELVEDQMKTPKWDPRLTQEQIDEAKSRDIYEATGPEYEQYLEEIGLHPIEETKEETKPEWDPRLTEEQKMDAYARDIYEPVGQEYEQFLAELGLSQPENTQEEVKAEEAKTEEVKEEEKTEEETVTQETPVVSNQPEFKEEVIIKELPPEKQQTLFYGTIGEGHLDPAKQFEKELNMEFDPDRYEIIYDQADENSNVPYKIVEKYEKETRIVPVLSGQLLLEDKQMGKQPLGIEDKHAGQLLLEDKQMNKNIISEIDVEEPKIEFETKEVELEGAAAGAASSGSTANVGSQEIEDRSFNIDVQGRSLETILREITLDKDGEILDLTPKERKKITKGKIQVTKNLKERVQHGNWVYNLLGVTSALIPAVVQIVTKLTNKVYTELHPEAKHNHEQIMENLYKLSYEDLEVLRTELTNNKAVAFRSYAAIMPMVYERLTTYIEERYNQPLRDKITLLELELQETYKQIYALKDKFEKAEGAERDAILQDMKSIASGSAEKVYQVMNMKNELARNIEGGPGAHVFGEGSKAVDNNMNDIGHAFSKKKGLEESEEFNLKESELGDKVKEALRNNDDLSAVLGYIDKEMLELLHTREQASLAGRVSSGEYQWKAMPESLNYGNDPLMGYVFTTISTIALAKGIMSEIHNMQLKDKIDQANMHNAQQQVDINGRNASNMQANQHNQETMDQIHQTGANLEGKSDQFVQGMNQMSKDSVVGNRTAGEYNAADSTNWSMNSEYHQLDSASHESVHQLYDQANQGFDQIQKGVSNGTLDSVSAMEQAHSILTTMNTAKYATYQQFLETIAKYTASHPNIDYVPLQTYMDNIVNNPSAIDAMVDGMTEAVQAGRTLQEAVLEVYSPIVADIQGIPADIESLIGPLITQAALTGYLNRLSINYDKKLNGPDQNAIIEEGLLNVLDYKNSLEDGLTEEEVEEVEEGRSR